MTDAQIEDLEGLTDYYVHGMGGAIVGIRVSINKHHRHSDPKTADDARELIEAVRGSLDTLPVGRNATGDDLVTHTRAYLDAAQRYLNGEISVTATEGAYWAVIDHMEPFRDAFMRLVQPRIDAGETITVPSLAHGAYEFI